MKYLQFTLETMRRQNGIESYYSEKSPDASVIAPRYDALDEWERSLTRRS